MKIQENARLGWGAYWEGVSMQAEKQNYFLRKEVVRYFNVNHWTDVCMKGTKIHKSINL